MNKFKWALYVYLIFDLFFGGVNGGLIPLLSSAAAQGGPAVSLSVTSSPGVSTQASASVGAGDNVRFVADEICFSAGSTTAPALTQLNVNLRDGASGAGTVLMSFVVVIPAAAGQNQAPFCKAGLSVAGTKNTAMTAEWSAALTNLFEHVTLLYHRQP